MSLQHAQAYIEGLRTVREAYRYGRGGRPRGPGAISEGTPEATYAAAYLRFRTGEQTKSPNVGYYLITPDRAELVRQALDAELAR